jgi:hypothetical protein
MSNIYLVRFYDGYSDGCDFIAAIFTDEQQAVDYAASYPLEHDEITTVEERQEGEQHGYHPDIYHRRCYDHTQVLFNSTYYIGYDKTKEEVEKTAISQASPMCVNIDWDRLYALYKEEYCDEED